ncbi:MAG: type II toxin-antitoxin system prevent-host-death family antitoxin [Cyanobacteria bacterium P01_F01_bin.116]
MQQVDIGKAEDQITQLFQSALQGEEIIITRDEQPILKLIPMALPRKRRKRGSAKGQIFMNPAFDEPLKGFADYINLTI